MKNLIFILLLLIVGCVQTKTVIKQKPFEECPASDVVIIGDYFGTSVPFKMKKGYFNDPSAAWMTMDDWIELMKKTGYLDKMIEE